MLGARCHGGGAEHAHCVDDMDADTGSWLSVRVRARVCRVVGVWVYAYDTCVCVVSGLWLGGSASWSRLALGAAD